MEKIERPLADAVGSAVSRSIADRAPCTPLDWRQLSHELRTPLNAILGNAELLLDGSSGPLSAQARACLGEIQTAGRQLLRQVQLLSAWSELGAARPQLIQDRVDLIGLIRALLTAKRSDAVQVEPQDDQFLIYGDRSRLQMLIAEILALDGACHAALRLKVERHAAHSSLDFTWSGFCPARMGALQIALVEAFARSQGAELGLSTDGISLRWPRQGAASRETTGTTGGASSPQRAVATGGERPA